MSQDGLFSFSHKTSLFISSFWQFIKRQYLSWLCWYWCWIHTPDVEPNGLNRFKTPSRGTPKTDSKSLLRSFFFVKRTGTAWNLTVTRENNEKFVIISLQVCGYDWNRSSKMSKLRNRLPIKHVSANSRRSLKLQPDLSIFHFHALIPFTFNKM